MKENKIKVETWGRDKEGPKTLLQYQFTRIDGETKLTSCDKIREGWRKLSPETNVAGFTLYQHFCAAPDNGKQSARPETEYWYSIVEAKSKLGGLNDAIKQLIRPPFTRSVDERGNKIEPVTLPLNLSKADAKVWED